MAEQIIISKADIADFHPLDTEINSSRIDPHILRAQQNDLEPVLGSRLYREFIEDYDGAAFQTTRFINLFKGVEYEAPGESGLIYFRGVKPLLAAFAYARLVENNSTHVTRAGVRQKLADLSEEQPQGQINQKGRDAVSAAIRLEDELLHYLDSEKSTYPEYSQLRKSRQADRKSSWNFEKVHDRVRPDYGLSGKHI